MTFKYYKTTSLIITIILLSGLIDLCIGKLINPFIVQNLFLKNHISVPTTLSILGGLFAIYNQYLWKLPFFKLLMCVPDMSGRYEGKISYEWKGKNEEKNCFIEIKQTASKIKLNTYFSDDKNQSTSSKSIVEDIKYQEDGFYEIFLFYHNAGSKKNGELDSHDGANVIRYIPDSTGVNNQLIGHYFTNRRIQTRGEIEATLISKKLNGKF